ncbi:MAG: hypothetical protein ACYC6L_08045 [Anaerolineae bacterium]
MTDTKALAWQLATSTILPNAAASRRLSFFDEALPAGARNIRHAYPPVRKLGIVLEADAPWESEAVASFCSTILRLDDGRYRLYYTTVGAGGLGIAVAESADGLHWQRLALNQAPYEGRPTNRIVLHGVPERQDQVCQPQVLRLPDGRWRMYYWHHQHGWGRLGYTYTVAESADGLEWQVPHFDQPALVCHWPGDPARTTPEQALADKALRTNDANYVYYNPRLGCYEQFSQWLLDARPERRVDEDNAPMVNRMIQRRVSADGLRWSAPELVLQADARDPWDQQFYHLAVQYHADWLIGSLGHYRVENAQQTQDLELVFSRDGRSWQRPLRGGFIPCEPGGRDSEGIYPPNAWILQADNWLCLYSATARKHNQHAAANLPPGAIAAAAWPRERFVGLQAGRVPGGFLTPVFYPQGEGIFADADIRGWLRAELCDAWGVKRAGCSLANCEPVRGDASAHRLHWPGSGYDYRYEPVRLRFEYAEGEIYGVRF